ncbi:MAG: serine/threonine protein kinase [Blastocatellia bacterium]|nr:serine/threonine protein kinase [Blastocatellia bacterium]
MAHFKHDSITPEKGLFRIDSWDRYQFLTKLGQGGMGVVYKVWDAQANRIAALKFLRSEGGRHPQRLLQEAEAQSRIDHPGVCRVFEVGEIQRMPYIAMQFIDGPSLQAFTDEVSLETKVILVLQMCQALIAAHRQGIVHRDLKPSNVLVERKEGGAFWSYLLDFGLAQELCSEPEPSMRKVIRGTPAYMSPEQAGGHEDRVTERTDVYGLGAVLYRLLTGHPPFLGASAKYILSSVRRKRPTAPRAWVPALPEALESITLKCLEKDPDRRYQSMQALAEDLQRFLQGEPVTAPRRSRANQILDRLRQF